MTAYNRESFIADAIESVLAQTFTDFELIIVDDCSRDRTVEIAQSYASRDRRIRIIVNEKNLGDYPNRNRAATLATGEFIKYHDSDDVMYPHCLALMTEQLAAFPEATVALSGEWQGGPLPMLLTPRMCYEREFLGYGLFHHGPPSAMFRRGRFSELGYFETVGPHSDLALWLRLCKTENIVLIPGGLFWYRVHAGQHLASSQAERDRAEINGRVWEALNTKDCPLDDSQREIAKCNWTWVLAKDSYYALRAGKFSLLLYNLQKCGLKFGDWVKYLRRPRRDRFAGTPLNQDGSVIMHRYPNYR
jgi:glycosyltransferase involved in cell wall biosynthesis